MKERFQAYTGNKPYIFVSYSHKDAEEVYKVIDQLAEEGYRIWYDQGIPQVTRYSQVIFDRIVGCGLFLVFFTRNSIQSEFVLDEVHLARDKNKRIFPVCLDNTPLPGELQLRMAAVELLMRDNHSEYSFQMKLREPLAMYRDFADTICEPEIQQNKVENLYDASKMVGSDKLEKKPPDAEEKMKPEKEKTIMMDKSDYAQMSKILCVIAWTFLLLTASMPAWYVVHIAVMLLILWGLYKSSSFRQIGTRKKNAAIWTMVMSVGSFFVYGIAEYLAARELSVNESPQSVPVLAVSAALAMIGFLVAVVVERKDKNAVFSVCKLLSGGALVLSAPILFLAMCG